MALPDHGAVGEALKHLLVVRGNKPLSAQEAYRLLADYFGLLAADLNRTIKSGSGSENAWHNRCRTARGHLVKSGALNKDPHDSWSLTARAFKGLTSTAEELGL